MIVVFYNKVKVEEDVIVGLLSQVTPFGSVYSMDQTIHTGNEFAGIAALLIPTMQEVQIVTVMDKVLEHDSLYNKILIWFSTLFLTLFLGFTIETYSEENMIYIFMAVVVCLIIYSIQSLYMCARYGFDRQRDLALSGIPEDLPGAEL